MMPPLDIEYRHEGPPITPELQKLFGQYGLGAPVTGIRAGMTSIAVEFAGCCKVTFIIASTEVIG